MLDALSVRTRAIWPRIAAQIGHASIVGVGIIFLFVRARVYRTREAEGRSITVEPLVQAKGEAVVSMSRVGVNNQVGVGGSVALQTAKGIIWGKRDLNVRVQFDCGAHR